jgi:DNA-directed RNA polymerase subunit H (RpoH/RPB5)
MEETSFMYVVIDRFEGDKAVLELPDQTFVDAPAILFKNAKEGDVVLIAVDSEETRLRKEEAERIMKKMMNIQ